MLSALFGIACDWKGASGSLWEALPQIVPHTQQLPSALCLGMRASQASTQLWAMEGI